MRKRLKRIYYIASFAFFMIMLGNPSAKAADLTIEYDGKSVTYQDTQVIYNLDGNRIASLYPGVIIDGVSLAPCTETFIKSGMGITYKYSKAKGTLILYHNKDSIRFTIGSKKVKVNGKSVTVSLAPRIIRFPDKGKEKVYVPARFVAETFGFTYTWNSKSGIAAITSPPLRLKYDDQKVDYTGIRYLITSGEKNCSSKTYPGLMIGKTIMAPAKVAFAGKAVGGTYTYSGKTGQIVIEKFGTKVQMKLGSTEAVVTTSKGETTITLPEAPRRIQFLDNNKVGIYVPLQAVAEAIGYEYLPFLSMGQINLKAPYAICYAGEWRMDAIKGSVTFDGNPVDVAPMYSYIESNTAMLRAEIVFSGALGCTYQYDSSSRTVTIAKGETTISYEIDSMTALVNNQPVELTAPAREVINGQDNKSYIMVPGRFTAETLGYNYEWLNAGKTSVITTKEPVANDPVDNPAELPSERPNTGTDTNAELFAWQMNPSFQTYLEESLSASNSVELIGKDTGNAGSISSLLAVTQTATLTQGLYDTYQLHSADGFSHVRGTLQDGILTLTLSATVSSDMEYPFTEGLVSKAVTSYQGEDISTIVTLTLSEEAASNFILSFSEDYKVLTVRLFRKCLTGVTGKRTSGVDVVTLSGTHEMKVEVINDGSTDDSVLIQVNGILDTLSDMNWTDTTMSGNLIHMIRIPISSNQTQFLLQKKSGTEMVLIQNGTEIRMLFSDPNAVNYSLKIPFMPGTDINQIQDTDYYRNNYFTITLPGNQIDYLDANPILNMNSTITDIRTGLNTSGNTVVTIKTAKIQAYKIHYADNYLWVEVDNPKNLYDKIVVLDAGHGGKDPGTIKGGVSEKDINLQIIYTELKNYLEDSDIKVYWTREDDTFIDLYDRADYASMVGADLFVSLHMNSMTNTAMKGLMTFYSSNNTATTLSGLDSKTFASILQENLVNGLGAANKNVRDSKYVVCKNNTVPVILIELGFLSNAEERKLLTSSSYQKKAAKIIVQSLQQVFEQYPTGR